MCRNRFQAAIIIIIIQYISTVLQVFFANPLSSLYSYFIARPLNAIIGIKKYQPPDHHEQWLMCDNGFILGTISRNKTRLYALTVYCKIRALPLIKPKTDLRSLVLLITLKFLFLLHSHALIIPSYRPFLQVLPQQRYKRDNHSILHLLPLFLCHVRLSALPSPHRTP